MNPEMLFMNAQYVTPHTLTYLIWELFSLITFHSLPTYSLAQDYFFYNNTTGFSHTGKRDGYKKRTSKFASFLCLILLKL